MKKNYFLRAAAVLLVVSLFGLCIIPGTMGKFESDFTAGGNTIRAGLFEVKVMDGEDWVSIVQGSTGQTIDIGLYETLTQAGNALAGTPAHSRTGTATEGAIKDDSANHRYLIAPGCGGQFKIAIWNLSEVDVEVNVTAGSITGGLSAQIEWWTGSGWSTVPPVITSSSGNTLPYHDGVWESNPVIWRWEFERGGTTWRNTADQADTNLGRTGGGMSLPVTISVVQVD